jgi:DNA polymerase alpha-associated DNA helicase A
MLTTLFSAGGRSLDRFEFDVVIIDEGNGVSAVRRSLSFPLTDLRLVSIAAAQATEPACWIPVLKGKKLILVRWLPGIRHSALTTC